MDAGSPTQQLFGLLCIPLDALDISGAHACGLNLYLWPDTRTR